jgi:CheY-like chemotaxis protein
VETVTASSGPDALRVLLHRSFDLLLLDVNMPGMDGFQMAALVRGRPALRGVPIVFLTAIEVNPTHMFFHALG